MSSSPDPPEADQPKREIPVRRRKLGYEPADPDARDPRQDLIVPLAAGSAAVAILGLTCAPISTAYSIAAARQQQIDAGGQATTLPPAGPGPIAIGLVALFVGIALLGVVGSVFTILLRNWGRLLLIGFAACTLLYLVGVVYYRLRVGIEGLTETAPTRSALIMSLVCPLGTILVTAGLMAFVIRYFTKPEVAAAFR